MAFSTFKLLENVSMSWAMTSVSVSDLKTVPARYWSFSC